MKETENSKATEEMQPIQDAEETTEAGAQAKGNAEDYQLPPILRKGILTLTTPVMSRDEDVTEIEYDFERITGQVLLSVMDSKSARERATTGDDFTARQGLFLFAKAARGSGGLDEMDITTRLSAQDTLAAAQLGKLFFTAMALQAQRHIKSV